MSKILSTFVYCQSEAKVYAYLQHRKINAGFSNVSASHIFWFMGAVSYRFSQGLLNLMCNNSKLKADINFFVLSAAYTNSQSL